MRDVENREVGEEPVERVWGEWKTKVMSVAERRIGKKISELKNKEGQVASYFDQSCEGKRKTRGSQG